MERLFYFYYMSSFLEETLLAIGETHQPWNDQILILPSKRACGFVRYYLRQQVSQTVFAPAVISIEQLITAVSGLKILSGEALLVESYSAYLQMERPLEKDGFNNFCDWSTTVMADFNELDRYLVPSSSFFDYLSSIKSMERWGSESEEKDLSAKYLEFWELLETYYETLKIHLRNLNCGYQGLVYRQAAEDIEHYLGAHRDKHHIFIGFNALNTAEQQVIQAFLEEGMGSIYWDVDQYFYNKPLHGASRFVRRYFEGWKYYKQAGLPSFGDHYQTDKQIEIAQAANGHLQVKYVANLLDEMDESTRSKTAIVLADERMLDPLLLSLPDSIDQVNITMGAKMDHQPMARWIQELFLFQSHPTENWYYKDLFRLIDSPVFRAVHPASKKLVYGMNRDNKASIDIEGFAEYLDPQALELFKDLLVNPKGESKIALDSARGFLQVALSRTSIQPLERLVCKQLMSVLDRIGLLISTKGFLNEIRSLIGLWEVIIRQEQLDFEGDAYQGLQIMGVLETRVLDFDHLIILSVNEGVLPLGRSNASYITTDMKTVFSLPNYQDKDAIYTYHYFRLLQRAKTVYLCYNTSSSGLTTGEPSRYITQMLYEQLESHQINQVILTTPQLSNAPAQPIQIEKTPEVMERLQAICESGWSPSSLASYLYNPVGFYSDKILGVKESDRLEEEVASKTMGIAVHAVLENLYKPLVGQLLTQVDLQSMIPKIASFMEIEFRKEFRKGSFERGKNLIVFEVAQRFVRNQIEMDLKTLQDGSEIHLVGLEEHLEMQYFVPDLGHKVKIKGFIDRIDRIDGQLRIIDYKTGGVKQSDLNIVDWESLIDQADHLKAIQVLIYALLIKTNGYQLPVQAGIISFKNFQAGFMPFGKKENPRAQKTDSWIDDDILESFGVQLNRLILELMDPSIPFVEERDLSRF